MGAIVMVGTRRRSWFIAAMSSVSQSLPVDSWDDLKPILTTFLWLNMKNDIDGTDVWEEVSLLQFRYDGAAQFSSSHLLAPQEHGNPNST
jgi:hypothetical protein